MLFRSVFVLESAYSTEEMTEYYNDILIIGDPLNYGGEYNVRIRVNTFKIPEYDKAISVKLKLKSKAGAYGRFTFEGQIYEAKPNYEYEFDITGTHSGSILDFFAIDGEDPFIEFYTTGADAPELILDFISESEEEESEADKMPAERANLKQYSFDDNVAASVDLNNGVGKIGRASCRDRV